MTNDAAGVRKLDTMAWDLLERLGEAFPDDLEFDRDGPVNQRVWVERVEQFTDVLDSYVNAIPPDEPADPTPTQPSGGE